MLPSGYTRLEHIESTGTQYIDTGVVPTVDTRVVLDIEVLSYPGSDYVAIFGERHTTQTTNLYSFWISSASTFRTDFGSSAGNTTITANTVGRYVIDKNKNVTTVLGQTATNPLSTIDTTYSIYLLSNNYAGVADERRAEAKIYSCQIYDTDTLIRDLIPSKSPDGAVGMYDIVNDVFYTNAGTGEFGAGAEITAPTLYSLSEDSVTIQWSPLTDATEYRVYRDKVYIGSTADTSWTDNTVQPYSRYYYHIETDSYTTDALVVETPGSVLPELVTDRTQADVDMAKQIITKLLAGETLTAGERREYDNGLRGCYNASDATRVELHMRRLQKIFNENGYSIRISTRMWAMCEYMRYDDIVRYLDNIRTLTAVIGKSGNTPDVPDISRWIDHIAANDIERILLDLSELAAGAIAMFRIAGTFTAGNDYILQIIRR